MKAAVLARGLGRRMQAADPGVTLDPTAEAAAAAGLKAMMPVGGADAARPFLDFGLGALADAGCTDVALVIGPEHRAIRRYYAEEGRPARVSLTFVEQAEAAGTADAVLACEPWAAGDPFLVVNGDNLYPVPALRALVSLSGPGLPAFRAATLVSSGRIPADRIGRFALVETDRTDALVRIVEKPGADAFGPGALVSMNCWRFDSRIFAACRAVPRSVRGEYELPEAVALAVDRGVRFEVFAADGDVLDLSSRADVGAVRRALHGVHPRP